MVMHPETTKESNKKLRPSSSSSSSALSLGPPEVESGGHSKAESYTTSSSKPELDAQSLLKHVSSTGNSSRSKELDNGSPVLPSTSPVSQITHESSVYDLPSTQSPPLQVMDRLGGYDPLRIPSTVFERRDSTPLELSSSSSESLFSLHLGNNSISIDHGFMLGGDALQSGEIPESGEFIKFSPSSPVPVEETKGKSLELKKIEEFGDSDDSTEVSTIDTAEDQILKKGPPTEEVPLSSNLSTHSKKNSRSFAFPLTGKRCTWPSGYCSGCSCTFCYCSFPSCYCSDCSCAFCDCWTFSLKKWCCHCSIPNHSKTGLGGSSEKAKVEKHLNQYLADKMASTSSACCCCTSSSCRPHCCRSHCSQCC